MLYHISVSKIDKFELRPPKEMSKYENRKISRVCFSRSIEGALTAMPRNLQVLDGYFNLKDDIGVYPIFYLYSVDEKTIDRKYIIKSNTLFRKMGVKDAKFTNEVWLTNIENLNMKCTPIIVNDFFVTKYKIKKFPIWKIHDIDYLELNKDDERLISTENMWKDLNDKLSEHGKSLNGYLLRYFISSKSSFHTNE